MRVLLVERPTEPKTVATFLQSEGLTTERTECNEEILALLRRYPFDLVLLNGHPLHGDPVQLISRVRSAGYHIPVVALLATTCAKRRSAALSAGADDVVESDIDRLELVARMRAVVRRSRGFSQSILRCGRFALDVERQIVTVDNQPVHLTQKEFHLLQTMIMRKNVVMTKEAIMTNLYGGLDEPDIKIIDVFMCKVRTKLAKAGLRNLIRTVWGRGYVLSDTPHDDDASEPHAPQPINAGRSQLAFV